MKNNNYMSAIKELHQRNRYFYEKQKQCDIKVSNYAREYIRIALNKLPDSVCCGQISLMQFYVSPASKDNSDFCIIDFDKLEVCYYKRPLERFMHLEIARCDSVIDRCQEDIHNEKNSGVFDSKRRYIINNFKHLRFDYLSNQEFEKEQKEATKRIKNLNEQIDKAKQTKKALKYCQKNYIYYLDQIYQIIKNSLGKDFTYIREELSLNDIRATATLNDMIKYYKIFSEDIEKEMESNRFLF